MAAAVVPMPSIEIEQGLGITPGSVDAAVHQHDPEQKPEAPVSPPATDESNKDHGSPASELSDLDLDEDDDEDDEIEPDHYYDGGKIPVFKPVSLKCFTSPTT